MARSLASKPNVVAPGGDFPFGRIKDNSGDGSGTPVNERVYGDIHQFFEKLMSDASILANDLPESDNDGYQYIEALDVFIKNAYNQVFNTSALRTRLINIGDWDMDSVANINVALGIDYTKVVSVDVQIKSDLSGGTYQLYPLLRDGFFDVRPAASPGGIELFRNNGGFFDSTTFNDTAGYNRGFIVIQHLP